MKKMMTGGMKNANKSIKVSPAKKMEKGGMAKAMYGKTMMKKRWNKEKVI